MPRAFLRSILFNILFYCLTAIACVLCLPTLILPRRFFMGVVYAFVHTAYFLERTVLGLKLEVRGRENLPQDGAYIVAAKHQSAYETLKLHVLFKDPAVILKKELLSIPLWGLYLKKSDPIAIDRSNPDSAIESINTGALRVKGQGRPIVIFPQGTRVSTEHTASQKPYKIGVARIQEATELPIIPVALNAGLYWPRNGFFKSSGTVVISILPAIEAGKDRSELLQELEETIEVESLGLMNEARESLMDKAPGFGKALGALGVLITLLFGIYSYVWFSIAEQTQSEYGVLLRGITNTDGPFQTPEISGFPGPIKLHVEQETIRNDRSSIQVKDLNVHGWPLPTLPIHLKTGPVSVQYFKWPKALEFESLSAAFSLKGQDIVKIHDSKLTRGDFLASTTGTLDMEQKPIPRMTLDVQFENHTGFLQELGQSKILPPHMAAFMNAGFSSLSDADGRVSLPVRQKNMTIFVGPLPLMTLEEPLEYDPDLDASLHPIQ